MHWSPHSFFLLTEGVQFMWIYIKIMKNKKYVARPPRDHIRTRFKEGKAEGRSGP